MTTIAQETPNPENTIARVSVADDPKLVPTVVDFARSVTEQVGLEAEAARRLGQTLGEATAVHPYSQKGSLELGAKETGFLLGYIPGSVSYKDIGEDIEGRRCSVALLYTRTNPEPERTVYPPAAHREIVRRIIEHNGLRRTVGGGATATSSASST